MSDQDHDIRQHAAAGRKIEAIRLYRQRYGVGLAEAKDAVEAMAAGQPVPAPQPGHVPFAQVEDPAFRQSIESLLHEGRKIDAIKLYRDRRGGGLKEAKETIEAWQSELGLGQAKSGCFIATAAYGSAAAPEVEALRHFRDRVLQRSALGRAFIRAYYRASPAVAARVGRSKSARALARWLLRPIASVCRRRLMG